MFSKLLGNKVCFKKAVWDKIVDKYNAMVKQNNRLIDRVAELEAKVSDYEKDDVFYEEIDKLKKENSELKQKYELMAKELKRKEQLEGSLILTIDKLQRTIDKLEALNTDEIELTEDQLYRQYGIDLKA